MDLVGAYPPVVSTCHLEVKRYGVRMPPSTFSGRTGRRQGSLGAQTGTQQPEVKIPAKPVVLLLDRLSSCRLFSFSFFFFFIYIVADNKCIT
jgi:hypothetical protein